MHGEHGQASLPPWMQPCGLCGSYLFSAARCMALFLLMFCHPLTPRTLHRQRISAPSHWPSRWPSHWCGYDCVVCVLSRSRLPLNCVCTAGRYIREASLVRSASSVPLDFGHQLSVQDQRQVARHGKCGVLDSSLSFGRWLFLTVSAFFAKLCHAADQSGCRASRAGAQQAEHV